MRYNFDRQNCTKILICLVKIYIFSMEWVGSIWHCNELDLIEKEREREREREREKLSWLNLSVSIMGFYHGMSIMGFVIKIIIAQGRMCSKHIMDFRFKLLLLYQNNIYLIHLTGSIMLHKQNYFASLNAHKSP